MNSKVVSTAPMRPYTTDCGHSRNSDRNWAGSVIEVLVLDKCGRLCGSPLRGHTRVANRCPELQKLQAKRRSATARPVVAPQVASQPAPGAAQAGPAKPQAPHTPGPASAEAAPQQVQVVVVAEVDEGAPPSRAPAPAVPRARTDCGDKAEPSSPVAGKFIS